MQHCFPKHCAVNTRPRLLRLPYISNSMTSYFHCEKKGTLLAVTVTRKESDQTTAVSQPSKILSAVKPTKNYCYKSVKYITHWTMLFSDTDAPVSH